MTALLRAEGWQVNIKRVYRILGKGVREAAWQFERATARMLDMVTESDTSAAELHCLTVYMFASAAARFLSFEETASFESREALIRLVRTNGKLH